MKSDAEEMCWESIGFAFINTEGIEQGSPWGTGFFGEFVKAEFKPVAQAGRYRLLRQSNSSQRPLRLCAWYKSRGLLKPSAGQLVDDNPIELQLALSEVTSMHHVARILVADLDTYPVRVLADTTAIEPNRKPRVVTASGEVLPSDLKMHVPIASLNGVPNRFARRSVFCNRFSASAHHV